MKRTISFSLARLATLLVMSTPAFAALDQIILGPATQLATFTGANTDVTVQLGDCAAGKCVLSGPVAFGTGQFLGDVGSWSVTTNAANQIKLSEESDGLWSMSALQPLSFTFNFGLSVLLTGTMNLVSMQQGQPTFLATLDQNSDTLNKLGGSLAPLFPSGAAALSWTVSFAGPSNLESLLGSGNVGHKLYGLYTAGQIVPTPEPGSVFMVGTGLIFLGGILRSRWLRARFRLR